MFKMFFSLSSLEIYPGFHITRCRSGGTPPPPQEEKGAVDVYASVLEREKTH